MTGWKLPELIFKADRRTYDCVVGSLGRSQLLTSFTLFFTTVNLFVDYQ